MGFPIFKSAPFFSEPIVSIVMRGMHVVLRMRQNGESIFARHAERGQPRRDGPSEIVWDRVGALDDVCVRQCPDEAAKRL